MLGVSPRTVARWRQQPESGEDQRRGPKDKPRHALTKEERARVVAIATSPAYRNLSVRQIVPRMADKGDYVASESTFYRVLHEENLMAHRNAARPSKNSQPRRHIARGPREVWSWDITYLLMPTI